MLQTLKSKLPQGGLKLDPRLTLIGAAALAALLAVGVALYLWRDQGSYKPLYGVSESYPAAEVMQVLEQELISFKLHPQSGQVLVREEQMAQARMLLAANGVQVKVPAGYELFDKDEPLGTSQFVQDVRLKRSLEGELARTVMAFKGVDHARVHLAQQENSSFVVGKRDPAKASVMLQLAPGYSPTQDQVGAIVNLIAGSVPQLDPVNVQVVDQFGVLLSRELDARGGPKQNWKVVDSYQQKSVANAEAVLAPVLGAGNFRISVAADIDFNQREETLQTYGENPRLRSEVLRDESVLDQLALGVPGSLANRPPIPQPAGAEAEPDQDKGASSLRKESNRQLDYDQSIVHVKHAPHSLIKQSIAVVLNSEAAPKGGWSADERDELDAMVRSAVGFNEARGDVLTLSVFPFTSTAINGQDAGVDVPLWENPKIHEWAQLGVFALLSLLLLLLVVRPAMRSLTQRAVGSAQPALSSGELSALQAGEGAERLLSLAAQTGTSPLVLGELSPLSEITLPAPGSGLELQIEHLQMLAKNDPERVSEVIKQWIGRNERDTNPV